ncbi:AbfB domain-containing protein [Solwaraspora sp. WMMA2080]|uniref:AbfB domain-containing protein n=1 Tax=unclassified Solwaraspora TaxID=2627926 RepID=UPI00248B9F04|nr:MULTISPECIES: AbfB domain-containing protein [unclassified Solwaraspora]WBB99820.1 AbfB domain-containing protein [Solwaraspora sp. WMMA2059]WBC21632.1 AbfB domain-containing protein [Solwaraspora sp. WMMA2080]
MSDEDIQQNPLPAERWLTSAEGQPTPGDLPRRLGSSPRWPRPPADSPLSLATARLGQVSWSSPTTIEGEVTDGTSAAGAGPAADRPAPGGSAPGGRGPGTHALPAAPVSHADRSTGSPRRTAIGAVAVLTAAVIAATVATNRGAQQEPIRGEFVAGAPSASTSAAPPAEEPSGEPISEPSEEPTDRAEQVRPVGDGVHTATPDTDAPGGGPTPAAPATNPQPDPKPTAPAHLTLTVGGTYGLEPVNLPGRRVRHFEFEGRVDVVDQRGKADAAFVVRRGLAKSSCISLESVNFPGYYLRHQNFRFYLHRIDGSALFRADATFCPVAGLTGQHTSLRSYNYPDRYLHHDGRYLKLSEIGRGANASYATFIVRTPL